MLPNKPQQNKAKGMIKEAYTQILAEFCSKLHFEDLPFNVIQKAKSCLIDTIGCMLLGSTRPQAAIVRKVILELGGTPEATVIGTGDRVSCDAAAYINSLQASGSRLAEDTCLEGFSHPGVCVIPAALAIGERVKAGGKDLILAIVIGYEIAMRTASAVTWKTISMGWHPRGGAGVFGSAIAAAKLLGIERPEAYSATMGLAGLQACGLFEAGSPFDGWYLFSACAARNGVESALLAYNGFSGGDTILEGDKGFCQAFSPKPKLERLTLELGKQFEILKIVQKRHSSSSLTHPAIDAILELKEEHKLDPKEIESIEVRTIDIFYLLDRHFPKNQMEGGHSLPYLIAVALVDGRITDEQFLGNKLSDPFIRDLFDRISVKVDSEHTNRLPFDLSATVVVKTFKGELFEKTRYFPHGDPRDPLTDEELRKKFLYFAIPVVGQEKATRILQLVQDLERMSKIEDMISLLIGSPSVRTHL